MISTSRHGAKGSVDCGSFTTRSRGPCRESSSRSSNRGRSTDTSRGGTVTEFDNVLFTTLTGNPQPLHLDAEFSRASEYGERIVNSLLTLGLLVGLTVHDLTLGTTIGNLGFDSVAFPAPLRQGDTLRSETEVIAVRSSASRPEAGVVTFEHRGYRQDGTLGVTCRRVGLMTRRGSGINGPAHLDRSSGKHEND